LVRIAIDEKTPGTILAEARLAGEDARAAKIDIEAQIVSLEHDIGGLTQQMDAPNVQYQTYLQHFEQWVQRRGQIVGDANQAGTIHYIEKQILDLRDIPAKLKSATLERDTKVREIYKQLLQLVSTYRSLYNPVQQFIEDHALAAAKFNFEFKASIACQGLEESLFSYVNQGRKGSFCGAEDGRKLLKTLLANADFDSEDGAVTFANNLLDHLMHDKRDAASPPVPILEQLRKGVEELDLLSYIFSFSYLVPRYSLKWSGKNIEELSPGERGTLLLIFYLLIDRREIPLIIDQPEENLDNQTVYELLVPCIKEARKKRQVIIVTHNPNLAVVCDADQVIHCSIDKQNRNKVTYVAGSLENPNINKFTIDVLEGTRPAFERRDSKYQDKVG
jgi:ATPase subunit of ABC transporter with duplicated ATPase domains